MREEGGRGDADGGLFSTDALQIRSNFLEGFKGLPPAHDSSESGPSFLREVQEHNELSPNFLGTLLVIKGEHPVGEGGTVNSPFSRSRQRRRFVDDRFR